MEDPKLTHFLFSFFLPNQLERFRMVVWIRLIYPVNLSKPLLTHSLNHFLVLLDKKWNEHHYSGVNFMLVMFCVMYVMFYVMCYVLCVMFYVLCFVLFCSVLGFLNIQPNLQCELVLQLVFPQTSEKSHLDPKCFIFGANSFLVVVLVWIPGRAWELLGWRLNSNKALNYQNILSLPAALIIWISLIYLLVI